ncbi:MAG: DUF6671 family protein [Flavobacterium sp.]|jgi:hypothetical protein|uniref:DUF6671 family protein n=1 Tax=Flavobacterium sp. TaxID=239 RepID=UPI003BA48A15
MNWFQGRKIIIATKHQKEKAIQPIIEQLGLEIFIPKDFDSDQFGTFSGEINRQKSAYETVKSKCLKAMNQYDFDLGIASEGSFGPHPTLHFAHADDEFLVLIDKKNMLEIVAREVSLETNFNAETISSTEDLEEFAKKALFPSHGLIIKDTEINFSTIIKDFDTWDDLMTHFLALRSHYGNVYVETDMRAHRNPSRMKVIQRTAEKLLEKIQTTCPNCHTPGYDVEEVIKGLRCEWCNLPTSSTLAYKYQCKKCSYSNTKEYPHGKNFESPEYCQYCNP